MSHEGQDSPYRTMFPGAKPLTASDDDLYKLGAAMTESREDGAKAELDNRSIPAGYTYFAQLVAHDLTQDPSQPFRGSAPGRPRNLRTPKLDLDWLYGNGPFVDPQLYERGEPLLRVGQTAPAYDHEGKKLGPFPNDVPRDARGFAQIADMRNDGHLISSQMHLLFAKAHNRLAEQRGFEEARRLLTFHYQWAICNELLPKLVESKVREDVLANGCRHFAFHGGAYVPTEFACAAFRLHSMVRSAYDFNRCFGPGPNRPPSRLDQLLGFTGFEHGGRLVPVPSSWIIDWNRFFSLSAQVTPNPSRCIDARLAPTLNVPDSTRPLFHPGMASRTLMRGAKMQLPSGQEVAKCLDVAPLDPSQIADSRADGKVAAELGFDRKTPLWYYIVKEAELTQNGERLGDVGSRIVAEVLIGLLQRDPDSYLAKKWSPSAEPLIPNRAPGLLTLLEFVGDINPLG